MGLDMYLERRVFIDDEAAKSIDIKTDFLEKSSLNMSKISSINFDIGKWRNAYAIQAWFHTTLSGIDNCTFVGISGKALKDLLNKCEIVLELYNGGGEDWRELASRKLPVDKMDVDDYIEHITETIAMLKPLDLDNWQFTYTEWY